jgi:hypothetical protein
VSTFANNLSVQTQACLAAFSMCRRYQDSAGDAISSCSLSPSGLTSKLKELQANKAAVTQATAALAALKVRLLTKQAVSGGETTCSYLLSLSQALVAAMKDNPASQLVGRLAEEVLSTAGKVVCSAADAAALQSLDGSLSSAASLIDEEVASVQSDLEGELSLF